MREGNYSIDYFGLKPPPERGCCAEREMYLGTLELFFEDSFPMHLLLTLAFSVVVLA